MNNVKSLTQKWNILIEGLKMDVLNKDFFTDVVKETYYHFKGICKPSFLFPERDFTTDEKELLKVVSLYKHQDDPAATEIQRLYYATQIVTNMLEFADYRKAPLMHVYISSDKGNAEFDYNVDTGDLSNIMEKIHYIY